MSVDGLEFDIQLSQDGAPVIHHDATLKPGDALNSTFLKNRHRVSMLCASPNCKIMMSARCPTAPMAAAARPAPIWTG